LRADHTYREQGSRSDWNGLIRRIDFQECPMFRSTENRNGFGIVILGIVLTVCALVNMWLRAPLVAEVLGPAAYGIAFAVSAIAACVAALVLDESEPTVEDADAGLPVELPVRNVDARR
jgi:hypothetical protein